jgi:hypothetical protein
LSWGIVADVERRSWQLTTKRGRGKSHVGF